MPQNVRNFWIELDVDGSKKRIETGPQRADGGFTMRILMRSSGDILTALRVDGFADSTTGTIRLEVSPDGEVASRVTGDISGYAINTAR